MYANFGRATLFAGDLLSSFCEVSEDCHLIQSYNTVLVVKDWKVIKRTVCARNFTLERCNIFPGFNLVDFPFVASYSYHGGKWQNIPFKANTFDLVNVMTGAVSPLIRGTANNLRG